MILLLAWLGVAVVLICASVFLCGMEQNEEPLAPMIACSAAWPIILALILVSLPFWGIWKLGERLGKHLDARAHPPSRETANV